MTIKKTPVDMQLSLRSTVAIDGVLDIRKFQVPRSLNPCPVNVCQIFHYVANSF